jgi:hypothetical protein
MYAVIFRDGSLSQMNHPWEFRDDPNWLATTAFEVGAEAVAKRIRDLVVENERLREEIRAMQGER